MFSIEQIRAEHSKVKSGADFPAYIKAIKAMGVTHYETFVADGHTEYYGENDFKAVAPGKYEPIFVSDTCNADQFKSDLKAHQQGKSDYQTFIDQCAQNGVEKWAVDMTKMTCTYFDKTDNEILTETIPQ